MWEPQRTPNGFQSRQTNELRVPREAAAGPGRAGSVPWPAQPRAARRGTAGRIPQRGSRSPGSRCPLLSRRHRVPRRPRGGGAEPGPEPPCGMEGAHPCGGQVSCGSGGPAARGARGIPGCTEGKWKKLESSTERVGFVAFVCILAVSVFNRKFSDRFVSFLSFRRENSLTMSSRKYFALDKKKSYLFVLYVIMPLDAAYFFCNENKELITRRYLCLKAVILTTSITLLHAYVFFTLIHVVPL